MQDHGIRPGRRRLKVLIVEDEFLIADYLALLIEEAGHEVVATAGTAAEALDLLDRAPQADVVSLDVKLPGDMDGVDLASALRARCGPPFFFVTGSGDPAARARCEALEPLAILQKPVDPGALLAVLDRVGVSVSPE